MTEALPADRGGGPAMLATLVFATALATVTSVCLFPQIVALSADLGQPVNRVAWAMIVIDVVSAGLGGVASALGAHFGNRRMLTITVAAILVGGVMCALSAGLAPLIAGRAVQALGLSANALAFGIAATFWSGRPLRRALSAVIVGMGLGAVTGYLLGGALWAVGGDWRTLMWATAAGAAVLLVLVRSFVKETGRVRGVRVDYLGCAGLIGWATLLLLPLSQANAWGWGSARFLGLLVPGVLVLVLWVLWELRCPAPLLDLRMLRFMGVWQGGVLWFASSVGLYTTSVIVPYLIQTPNASGFGFGSSVAVVSVVLAAPALAMTLFSQFTPRLMGSVGSRTTMLLGALFGLAPFGLALAPGSIWAVTAWVACTGMVLAWGCAAATAVGTEAVPPHQGVVLSTIFNSFGALGAGLGTAVAGLILSHGQITVGVPGPGGVADVSFPSESAFVWTAVLAGCVGLVAIACVLTVDARRFHVADREPVVGAAESVART